MTPRHLIQFATIIEHQSFSVAADALGTTQPGLSRIVADLERRLNVKLLAQRRRPVIPTSIGRDLAEQGLIIRAAISDANVIASDAGKGARGLLRIGAPPFICDYALAKIIPAYRSECADVEFEITAAYSDELHEMVANNKLDLGIGLATVRSTRSKLITEPMIDLIHAIVCRSGNPILQTSAGKRNITARQLSAADWVTHADNSKLQEIMINSLTMTGLNRISNAVKSESAGVITTLVQSSDCLTVLPVFSVLDALEEGSLSLVPVRLKYPGVQLVSLVSSVSALDPVRDRFAHYLKDRFRELQTRSDRLLDRTFKTGTFKKTAPKRQT